MSDLEPAGPGEPQAKPRRKLEAAAPAGPWVKPEELVAARGKPEDLVAAAPAGPRTKPAEPPKTCEQELKEKNEENDQLRKDLADKNKEIARLKERVAQLERLLMPPPPHRPLNNPYWGETPWDKKPEGPEFSL